ncbi:MAG: hypothetical protein ACP5IK_00190 [Candidatus Micrarchaeia archaeon]
MAIAGVALYLRLFYQPAVSIVLTAPTNISLYPYQLAEIPIKVLNNGGTPIRNMSIGVYVNSTLNTLYKVTLPPGKFVFLNFTYVPSFNSTFKITAVADPGRLYDIIDRPLAKSVTYLHVVSAEKPNAYAMLPSGNMIAEEIEHLNAGGYALASYLNATYGLARIKLTNVSYFNNFLDSILQYVLTDVKQLVAADATYANGTSASAVWLMGFLSPNLTNTAALINGLKAENISVAGKQVTVVYFPNNTTLCSYYSQGWLKMLLAKQGNCTSMLSAKHASSIMLSSFYSNTAIANAIALGNYSLVTPVGEKAGSFALLGNMSFLYSTISSNSLAYEDNICYGLITNVSNASYCSQYIFPKNGTFVGTNALMRTTAYIGNYNLSVFSLLSSSYLLQQVPINIGIIRSFGIEGKPLTFSSGITNTCSFNNTFSCSNVSFLNGNISFRLKNLNSTLRILNASCYSLPPYKPEPLNVTLAKGQAMNISVPCYDLGRVITGLALNLRLFVGIGYSINSTNHEAVGRAYIPIG